MRRRALLIVLFIASLLAVPAVQAENNSETVLAQGVAPITGENIAAARQAAIQDALRQAVEQGGWNGDESCFHGG